MTGWFEFDVSAESIEASLSQLLTLQKEGSPVEMVKLTKKTSDRPMNRDVEALFFDTLGNFPLVELKLIFSHRSVEFSCENLETTLQKTRPSLREFTLRDMTLIGNAEGLIRTLQDHPCLTLFALFRVHHGDDFPHGSMVRSIGTCPLLATADLRYLYRGNELIGPVLSGLCSQASLKNLLLAAIEESNQSVCRSMQKNTNIKFLKLNIDGMAMAILGTTIKSIGTMLEKNTALEELWVELSVPALSLLDPITGAMKSRNRTILSLHLSLVVAEERHASVVWPHRTVRAFEDMLKENTVLKDLRLETWFYRSPLNPLLLQESATIHFYLKLNRLGRQHWLQLHPNAFKKWADALVSTETTPDWLSTYRDDTSVVFYILSLNPALLRVNSDSNYPTGKKAVVEYLVRKNLSQQQADVVVYLMSKELSQQQAEAVVEEADIFTMKGLKFLANHDSEFERVVKETGLKILQQEMLKEAAKARLIYDQREVMEYLLSYHLEKEDVEYLTESAGIEDMEDLKFMAECDWAFEDVVKEIGLGIVPAGMLRKAVKALLKEE